MASNLYKHARPNTKDTFATKLSELFQFQGYVLLGELQARMKYTVTL